MTNLGLFCWNPKWIKILDFYYEGVLDENFGIILSGYIRRRKKLDFTQEALSDGKNWIFG